MPTLGNPAGTLEILKKYNFNFQKRFGQNFLIDGNILNKIISSAGITRDDFVLEIGPGIGTMTQYLAESAREVVSVEIDRALIPILADTLSPYNNVTIINEDILKVDVAALARERNNSRPIKVVANLPYYITTPIIMGLFESHVPLKSITIMVQKEVAQRMQVGPGTKDYGALSLKLHLCHFQSQQLRQLCRHGRAHHPTVHKLSLAQHHPRAQHCRRSTIVNNDTKPPFPLFVLTP